MDAAETAPPADDFPVPHLVKAEPVPRNHPGQTAVTAVAEVHVKAPAGHLAGVVVPQYPSMEVPHAATAGDPENVQAAQPVIAQSVQVVPLKPNPV